MPKHKKSDFQKVKLRVGRSLPKDKNVTDLRFKSRKILLPQQFKEHSRPQFRFDLENLRKELENPKALIQINSLKKIRALLSSKASMNSSPSEIMLVVQKTCSFVSQRNWEIRKVALDVIKEIFMSLPEVCMTSFYPRLRTHISSAATHIDSDVREDSLRFLELILDHYPQAVCNSSKMLGNILDLISHKSHSSATKSRSLISNPNERITAQEWRIKVFHCFIKYLNASIRLLNDETADTPSVDTVRVESEDSVAIQRHFDLEIANMLKFSIKRTKKDFGDSIFGNAHLLSNILDEFIHLLLDTWKEGVPYVRDTISPHEVHDSEALKVMMIVLKVMYKISEWVKLLVKTTLSVDFLQCFKDIYAEAVQSAFFRHFPLTSFLPRKNLDEITVFKVNLAFCEVFESIILGAECDVLYRKAVLDFIFGELESNTTNDENRSLLIHVFEKFLLNEKFCDHSEVELYPLYHIYCSTQDEAHIASGNLLRDLVLNPCYTFHSNEALQLWLEYLPKEFVHEAKRGELSEDYISTLKKIAIRGYPSFIKSLKANFDELVIVLGNSDQSVQNLAALLITKLEQFSSDDFYKLALTFRNRTVQTSNISYIVNILTYRANSEREALQWKSDFLNFLFNISVGISYGEEVPYMEGELYKAISKYANIAMGTHEIIPTASWSRYKDIVSTVETALHQLQLHNKEEVAECIVIFILIFLSNFDRVPLHSALAILTFYLRFVFRNVFDENIEYDVTNLILALFMYETALDKIPMEKMKRSEYSCYQFLLSIRRNPMDILNYISSCTRFVKNPQEVRFMLDVISRIIDSTCAPFSETEILASILKDFQSQFDVSSEPWYEDFTIKYCC